MTPAERAKHKMDHWQARGNNCPICKKSFRNGCDHSVVQAHNKLFENYVKAIVEK